ncbi:HdeD family acid-resistance protein [Testudinibacter sp. TR-2022]|uniref:HdeD family acid-resistance protein n=1 Tax=Testudinibacter sp. TR-2022 TaxID=2585029 RepID=UPI00111A5FEA|nr:DUF308 domain-containing protein [Testudinibacter sp. TR-2022]TNH01592.1 HdeD family acid-resistance protein [Pasteurellaceae bacterium Phil31]TNH06660.1 HdeD family acid-resistance protein [Testudinibacter sp. TR-2022]TNH07449.1 HdeD family acid-resistance protein [Testudinibacter sp. TR-2022]TNH13003.1 HdeD family acid-resistance protein [Testudinibacter sp. TR-2022]TNH14875.1 HdeD family acid-resistance protein [Testudinibacter sp. TR-2022]
MMKDWHVWLLIGSISILFGLFAIINPFAASIAVEQLISWIFILIGVIQIYSAWKTQRFSWVMLSGVIGLLVGLVMLTNPLVALISLTATISILLLCIGCAKLLASWRLRSTPFFGFVMFSGILSVLISIVILANLPNAAASLLGLLLAIELISNGISLLTYSVIIKKMEQE